MYVLGVDLHLFVKPFGAGNLFFTVQVIQSAILRSDVQAVVRSIDNLADSFSAQMVEAASVRIYLELVGAEYIIVDSQLNWNNRRKKLSVNLKKDKFLKELLKISPLTVYSSTLVA